MRTPLLNDEIGHVLDTCQIGDLDVVEVIVCHLEVIAPHAQRFAMRCAFARRSVGHETRHGCQIALGEPQNIAYRIFGRIFEQSISTSLSVHTYHVARLREQRHDLFDVFERDFLPRGDFFERDKLSRVVFG